MMGKVAVVTGATGGIGQSIVQRLAREENQVIGLYHQNREKASVLCAEMEKNGKRIEMIPCDLSDPNSVQNAFSRIYPVYHHVDLLVCSHGIASIRLFTDTDESEWNRILNINLSGTYRAISAVLPDMISRKQGSIITFSSIWGEVGASCEVAYSASKAGIIGLTKALAKEVGPSGIRVNCISPGVIHTEMNRELTSETISALEDETPLGRIGNPEEIAGAVAFLSSSDASFITGQVLDVSGGFVI